MILHTKTRNIFAFTCTKVPNMANRGAFVFLLYLWVIIDCGNGINRMDMKDIMSNKVALRHRLRYRRNIDCYIHAVKPKIGYLPLKENVTVKFYINGTDYFAKVTWMKPKVNAPISEFAVFWSSEFNPYNRDCKIVKNKTSTIITPSVNWSANDKMLLEVIPLPVRRKYTQRLWTFRPSYEVHKDIAKTIDDTMPHGQRKDSSKIVIGSVIGGSLAIVLIVILTVFYRKCKKPDDDVKQCPSGLYYVSYCPESESLVKRVENFVSWLRGMGFDVQTNRILNDTNELKLREIGPCRLGELLLGEAKNVFMIVSPSYLRLCRPYDQEQRVNTEEEKITNSEIAFIRDELYESAFTNDRFIPILFDVEEEELPFWIKELLIYTWPDDKVNDHLLYRLYNQAEYTPVSQ